ncbi:MAG: cytidine deaminase [Gemmatimonadota bacterium]|nr:cytidine deaminase [Gemmatimonadota bacterium]
MHRAYAPYSRFPVGAALEAADGRVFVGCNVENASFPGGLCAERSALAAAVAQGAREFTRIVIATESDAPAPPCGVCRQMLAEFAPRLDVLSCTARGARSSWTLAELLPHPFTPRFLEHE